MDPTAASSPVPAPTPAASAEYRLDPGLPKLWTLVALIPVLPLALAGLVVLSIFGLFWLLPAVVALTALLLWWTCAYGRRYVATFRCVLGATGLFVERGVWWRSQTFVPRARVQHTDVERGPLERRFGLATLVVHTAGHDDSEIRLAGLEHGVALALRDRLLAGGGDGA